MRKNRTTITCAQCGTPFEVPRHRAEIARFCSHSCYAQWRKGKVFQDIKHHDYIVREYTSGKSSHEIGREIGMTPAGVCYRLKVAGVPIRPHTGDNLRRPEVQEAARRAHARGETTANYKPVPIDDIVSRYESGQSTIFIANALGVSDSLILKRLKTAGVKRRPASFSRRRRCPDGDIADSQWEYAVDRWLADRGLSHEIHPTVPWYVNGKSPQRADFRVGDTFIEVWGVIGNEKYNTKRIEKIAKYAEAGYPLIEIFPHHVLSGDFSPLHALLPDTQ